MHVIGVVDLLGGRAVHARGGERARYQALASCAGVRIDGDPVALAAVYRDRFGIRELYVADLDAIGGGPVAPVVHALAALGLPMWLDAGVSHVDAAREALEAGASRVIVGLETLTSFDTLAGICAALGYGQVAFSLDLKDGVPLRHGGGASNAPERLAARAAAAGAGAILVIDLWRVGSGTGVDVALLARIRRSVPGVLLAAGGGVRTAADLPALAAAGCDGVLLATALHAGAIARDDLPGPEVR